MILVDRPYHERRPDVLAETVAHELAHVVTSDGHGPMFKAEFARLAPSKERKKPMVRDRDVFRTAHPTRVELRGAGGAPTGAEFLRLVRRGERELVRRAGPDALRWVASWHSVQHPADGTWAAHPTLARRRRALSVAEAEARTRARVG